MKQGLKSVRAKRRRGRPTTDTSQATITMSSQSWLLVDHIATQLGCKRSQCLEALVTQFVTAVINGDCSIKSLYSDEVVEYIPRNQRENT
jgi:hypothetical protein